MIINLQRQQIIFSSATWIEALAVVHVAHALFTFGALHWVKGSPDSSHISKRHLTMWEQIEPGINWKESQTKKWGTLSQETRVLSNHFLGVLVCLFRFLMIVPTLLLLATLMASRYSATALLIHLPFWVRHNVDIY